MELSQYQAPARAIRVTVREQEHLRDKHRLLHDRRCQRRMAHQCAQ